MLQVLIHLILATKNNSISLKAEDKKIPSTSVLLTTEVLDTKIREVENKVLDVSDIEKKTMSDAKIKVTRENILLLLITIN